MQVWTPSRGTDIRDMLSQSSCPRCAYHLQILEELTEEEIAFNATLYCPRCDDRWTVVGRLTETIH